jgi:GNAT superfamily N-acetyltransferase
MSAHAGTLDWDITHTPTAADVAAVEADVLRHGRTLASDGHPRPLAVLVRRNGELVAGGVGRTEFDRLFVTSLWVAEPLRGAGVGTRLLRQLEQAARSSGCSSSLIETLFDGVASLYERNGYEPLARIPDFVGPYTRHILLKTWGTPGNGGAAPAGGPE